MTPIDAQRNHVLAALPASTLASFARYLTPVRLEQGALLFGRHKPVHSVTFLITGVASLLADGAAGEAAEAALIGRDGVVGAEFVVAPVEPVHAVQQVAGVGLSMPFTPFRSAMARHTPLAEAVYRHSQLTLMKLVQAALCNRLHSVEQRVARWLLTVHDLADGPAFRLTQEQFAATLGVQRQTISGVAAEFRTRGLIAYRYGRVRILDGSGLERLACACYGTLRTGREQLLPAAGVSGRDNAQRDCAAGVRPLVHQL